MALWTLLGCGSGTDSQRSDDLTVPTPTPAPKESALRFSGEKQKVASVMEAFQDAERIGDAKAMCVDLNLVKPAAAAGDQGSIKSIPKCEAGIRSGRAPRVEGIEVTAVHIGFSKKPDPIGGDASAVANLILTVNGKRRKSAATLVRVKGSWYFVHFGAPD